MNLRAFVTLLAVLCSAALITPARAADDRPPSPPTVEQPSPEALFDRAVDLLAKNPAAAKPAFAKAAAAYEQLLLQPLTQSDRARILYNAAAAHQLAGDTGHALLNLRRAELLAPITPGLWERLDAARADAAGTSTVAAGPVASAHPAPRREGDFGVIFRDFALSMPSIWNWRIGLAAWSAFWAMFLLRITLPPLSAWRPHGVLLAIAAIACVLPSVGLGIQWWRESQACHELVVLKETIGRDQPDDLIGQPAGGAPFKPGTELVKLDERPGGNGQLWLRVRPRNSLPVSDEPVIWIPGSSVSFVLER